MSISLGIRWCLDYIFLLFNVKIQLFFYTYSIVLGRYFLCVFTHFSYPFWIVHEHMSYVLFDTFYNVRNVRKAHLNCGFCTFINVSQRHKFNVPFPMCVDTFLVLTGREVRIIPSGPSEVPIKAWTVSVRICHGFGLCETFWCRFKKVSRAVRFAAISLHAEAVIP